MIEKNEVDWAKVAWISAVGAVGPWLLGLAARRKFTRDYNEATRPRWTDANRWER